jgi:DNA topoisomerase IA
MIVLTTGRNGRMGLYYLTVFEKNGEKLSDESFEAQTEQEAKEIGQRKLEENNWTDKTHRCTSAAGKLVLFGR